MEASPQPHSGALMMPKTSANIATESSTMPGMSKDLAAFSARTSLRIHRPRPSASRPTGMLMKNTDSQLTCSTSRPPTIGPAAVEAPITPPQMPIAMLSFSAGKAPRSRPSAAGWSSAPNRPCSTRQAITVWMLPAKPIAAEVAAKPTAPTRKVLLWPNRSPILPAVIRKTARASR